MSDTPPIDITWETKEYGRQGELARLNRSRNNPNLGPRTRLQADRAHGTIVAQLQDKKLMGLRERLIKASLAGDFTEQAKIQMLMKDHEGRDKETGLYEQDLYQ